MSAKNGNKNSALVPRPPSAVEKCEPGAQRVLALMISDTLAIAQKHLAPVTTIPAKAEVENWFLQGNKYYDGNGVPQNYREAVKWFRKAAEQGHASAQFNLGLCYDNGEGGQQDSAEAVKWYRKAAEQGCAYAQFNFGLCYRYGQGVKKDYIEAYQWLRLAAEKGHKKAKEMVVSVGALLSPEKIAEGERRVEEFKVNHKT